MTPITFDLSRGSRGMNFGPQAALDNSIADTKFQWSLIQTFFSHFFRVLPQFAPHFKTNKNNFLKQKIDCPKHQNFK